MTRESRHDYGCSKAEGPKDGMLTAHIKYRFFCAKSFYILDVLISYYKSFKIKV